MTKRKQIAIAALSTLTVLSVSMAPTVLAQSNKPQQEDGNRLEHRMQKRAHKMDHRLDKLVEEGKITQQQKEAIEARLKENHDKMKEIKNLENKDQRKEAINSLHEDMKQWLTDQGIDAGLLKPHK